MTRKILIIGDSHSAKLSFGLGNFLQRNSSDDTTQDSDHQYRTKYIDKLGNNVWMEDSLVTYKNKSLNFYISCHPGRSALHFDFENFASGTQKEMLSDWNEEGRIIMPWFGYIDVRNWLPQTGLNNYVDVENVVRTYIDNATSKFNKARVIFIEPMPQFICIVTSRFRFNHTDPAIEFEDRHEFQLKFVSELRKQCLERGLDKPVSISDILGTDMIEPWMQPKTPITYFLNDHLKPQYYTQILEHIYSNVK
jgi:hypothetical protein